MSNTDARDPVHNGREGEITRREFLRHGAATAAAVAATAAGARLLGGAGRLLAQETAGPGPATAQPVKKSRVVVITHPEAILRDYDANRPVLEKMIERAVRELTGADSPEKAWKQVATTGDRVAMKTTRAGGALLRTHDEIPAYVARRLAEAAGVDKGRVRAWDRPDLAGADLELSDPHMLPSRKRQTRLRAALVKDVTAIINLPVLKVHSGTGASIAMKNHFGSINNPSVFHGWAHGEMWKSIAELNALEPIRKRARLVIVDATRPLFNGGPQDKPEYRWTFGGLIVGVDPVAVDRVGLDILDKKRQEHQGKPWPATDGRKVVDWAEHIGLGHAKLNHIDLVRIKLD